MEMHSEASILGALVLHSCMLCLAISTSNFTDQSALLAFKSEIKLSSTHVLVKNWTVNSNFCDWLGVSCSRRRQRVTDLSLRGLGLQGTISPHIGNLSFLVQLDLSNNSFRGHLTQEVGRLRRLKSIALEDNGLEGNIPVSLYNCQKLQIFSLASNKFTGGIPQEFSVLPLRMLLLGGNMLTGRVPPFLGNISSLRWLGIEYNNFHGNVPTELESLSNLERLHFDANELSGSIPPGMFNKSSMYLMSFSFNDLSGYLPSTAGLWLPNLEKFAAARNQLRGNIPSSLSNCSKLSHLYLYGNLFDGPIPASFGQLELLQYLILHTNQLAGQIPQEIGSLKNLYVLFLANNNLDGSIPSTVGGMARLQRLYLWNNTIEGSIPLEICSLGNLGEMDLHDNKLSGPLPSCIGNLSNLKVIILSSNSLSSIPSSLWILDNLFTLNLSFNSISGSLEHNLRALKVLGSMDLSWNQISGNIPSTIGDFQSLTSLNLSRNLFSGSMPGSVGNLITLDFLDLSHNNLSGAIPKSLEALSHLKMFNLSFNKLSGEIPTSGPFVNLTAQSFIGNEALCGKSILQVSPCETNSSSKSSEPKDYLLRYVLPAVASVVVLASLVYMLKKYPRSKVLNEHSVDLLPIAEHKLISYQELRHATNNFSEANLLGVGSVGSVYKGILYDGTTVAVKILNLQLDGALKSFDAECKVLGSVRHRNLVKLISSCSNLDLRALILQYMPNGSLEKWLYSHNYCLDLLQRVNIIVSTEGDMYSFGVMLLETFTRKKPTDEMFSGRMSLRQWVDDSLCTKYMEVFDEGLTKTGGGRDMAITQAILLATLEIGLDCTKEMPKERSGIKEVILKLNHVKMQVLNSGGA
ncbi:hypothetical protein RJ640_027397 [Escallonia rubra]|uniref:non-specific serine/threonine protein kinase n=1 Tax=Escallonia rubra TaxID=112253 RepID=A0AA88UQI4_9ASTE|nr:hypothetical protein RJ640_027397 [Escallonia rubra]